jgi:ubiquinone/menaquinone biosynthesis C-methylase UbiE
LSKSTYEFELEDLLSRYQKRVGFFIEHLIAWRSIHVSVLFVGCDHGGEAVCLRSLYPNVDVIGLDIKLPPANMRERFEFVRADACYLPFRADAINFCCCYHVLEHINNYSNAIGEMARVLRTEGASLKRE